MMRDSIFASIYSKTNKALILASALFCLTTIAAQAEVSHGVSILNSSEHAGDGVTVDLSNAEHGFMILEGEPTQSSSGRWGGGIMLYDSSSQIFKGITNNGGTLQVYDNGGDMSNIILRSTLMSEPISSFTAGTTYSSPGSSDTLLQSLEKLQGNIVDVTNGSTSISVLSYTRNTDWTDVASGDTIKAAIQKVEGKIHDLQNGSTALASGSVTNAVLTGFSAGTSYSAVAGTDTILQGFNKVQGNLTDLINGSTTISIASPYSRGTTWTNIAGGDSLPSAFAKVEGKIHDLQNGSTAISSAAIIASTMNGFSAGTTYSAPSSSDTILGAMQKVQGNIVDIANGSTSVAILSYTRDTTWTDVASGDTVKAAIQKVEGKTHDLQNGSTAIILSAGSYTRGTSYQTVTASDTVAQAVQKLDGNIEDVINGSKLVSSLNMNGAELVNDSGTLNFNGVALFTSAQKDQEEQLILGANATVVTASLPTSDIDGAGTIAENVIISHSRGGPIVTLTVDTSNGKPLTYSVHGATASFPGVNTDLTVDGLDYSVKYAITGSDYYLKFTNVDPLPALTGSSYTAKRIRVQYLP